MTTLARSAHPTMASPARTSSLATRHSGGASTAWKPPGAALVDSRTASVLIGLDPAAIAMLHESGKIVWAWNLAARVSPCPTVSVRVRPCPSVSVRRDIRYLALELLAPDTVHGLTIDAIEPMILPAEAITPFSRLMRLWTVTAQQLIRLREANELPSILHDFPDTREGREGRTIEQWAYRRPDLAAFLNARLLAA
jgi:hypothetical protein